MFFFLLCVSPLFQRERREGHYVRLYGKGGGCGCQWRWQLRGGVTDACEANIRRGRVKREIDTWKCKNMKCNENGDVNFILTSKQSNQINILSYRRLHKNNYWISTLTNNNDMTESSIFKYFIINSVKIYTKIV